MDPETGTRAWVAGTDACTDCLLRAALVVPGTRAAATHCGGSAQRLNFCQLGTPASRDRPIGHATRHGNGTMTAMESTPLKPRRTIRRFDAFAEYNRLRGLENGLDAPHAKLAQERCEGWAERGWREEADSAVSRAPGAADGRQHVGPGKSPSSAGTTATARSSPPGGSGAALVLERELELDTIRQRLARLDMHVLLDHAGDAQIPQRARSLLDGCGCRLLPGLIAGAHQRNHLVHALFCHAVLPSGIFARRGVSHRRTGPRRANRSITLWTNALATLPSLLTRRRACSRARSRGRFARLQFG